MNKNQTITLTLSLLFFLSAYCYMMYNSNHICLTNYQQKVEKYLHEQEAIVDQFMNDGDFIYRLTNTDDEKLYSKRRKDIALLEELANQNLTIYVTQDNQNQKDSIVFWNNNLVSLPKEAFLSKSGERSYQFIKHANGYYQYVKQTNIDKQLGQYTIHAMIPIKYSYPLESNYIEASFATSEYIPKEVILQRDFSPYQINNTEGKTMFYLETPENLIDETVQINILYLIALGFVFLGAFIHLTTLQLIRNNNPKWGAAFIILSVISLRLITILGELTTYFGNLTLFEKIIRSSWSDSMYKVFNKLPFFENVVNDGRPTISSIDMLINVTLLLWLMVFFHQAYPLQFKKTKSETARYAIMIGGYLSIVCSFFSLTSVFKMIVFDSTLTYNFDNVFSQERQSLLAIISVIMLLAALFIFSHRIILMISKLEESVNKRLISIFIANILVIPVVIMSDFLIHWMILFTISFILIMFFDMSVSRKNLNFQWLIIILGIMSAFPSFILFMYNSYLDNSIRADYAKDLSKIQDPYAEHKLIELVQFLKENKAIPAVMAVPAPFKIDASKIKSIIDQKISSDNYLYYNYDYNIYAFDVMSNPTIENQLESYTSVTEKIASAKKIKGKDSYISFYESKEDHRWSYLIDFPVKHDSKATTPSKKLVFEFTRNRKEQSKVYTELLIDKPYRRLKKLNKYDFAIFKNKKQIDANSHVYGSVLTLETLPEPGQVMEQDIGERTEVIYRSEDGDTVVIVGRNKEKIMKAVSLFSYILTILIGVLIIFIIINTIFKILPNTFDILPIKSPSLKNKIQIAVVALTVSSFMIIGVTTTWFFKNSSEEYHEKRLKRKASSVLTDAQRQIERMSLEGTLNRKNIKAILRPISETHRLDINLYDLDGHLIGSSEEDLYNRDIISKQMGAVAYQALSRYGRSNFTQNGEHIGNLTYKTAYVSLIDLNEKPVAYMGLPYYSKQSKQSNDVSLFMSTLINVYVFLLLFAGGIAMWTARSITKHISTIGEKLKATKLGQRNTPLEWKNDDEIGTLIKEYNKMIRQLDLSAEKLAKSEREGAWREMAKQVAHEIKNPLTPMKLSIQYLEHAFRSNPENAEPLMKRVSATLIEQIDNLAHIASEFSNFAKMPQAENQEMSLNHHFKNVYELFKRSENVNLTLDMDEREFTVYADKNHLMRVFNNLVKNAIQAIPEERKGKISMRLYKEIDDVVVVCVEDNGTGIPEDKQDKVFVPNFTTKNSGTGLGLAISKNIIESVDGRIWFETVVGVGTKFYVQLPIIEIRTASEAMIEEMA